MSAAKCRTCGKRIYFLEVTVQQTGERKDHPCEDETQTIVPGEQEPGDAIGGFSSAGNWFKGRAARDDDPKEKTVRVRISHFASGCKPRRGTR